MIKRNTILLFLIASLCSHAQTNGNFKAVRFVNVLDSTTVLPINATIYYNEQSQKFRAYENNLWKDLISYGGSGGSVTTVSIASANGLAGSVANPTTTPSITLSTSITGLLKGNGTAISAASSGTDYQAPISLTTTGSSGAATLIANTLNIPQYTGSTSPAGSNTQIQFNSSGSFGASNRFTWSGSSMSISNAGLTANSSLDDDQLSFSAAGNVQAATNLFLEGTNNVLITSGNTNGSLALQAGTSTSDMSIRLNPVAKSIDLQLDAGLIDLRFLESPTGTLQIFSLDTNILMYAGPGEDFEITGLGPGNVIIRGDAGANGGDLSLICDQATGSYMFITGLPTSCAGRSTNTIANVGGVLTVCP